MPDNFKADKRYAHLSEEQVQRHYILEHQLRNKILEANSQKRASVIHWAYEELFREIPWHPAITEESGHIATHLIEQKVRILLPLLPPAPARILEIGCGMGELLYGLAREGYNCTGIDISDVRVTRLKKSLIPRLSFARADATFLPFVSNYFDMVISSQLFEHIHPEDAHIHLEAVNRVMRVNGRYIIETPNRLIGPGDVSRFFVDDDAQGFHLKEYTIGEMVNLLHQHGFNSIRVLLNTSLPKLRRKKIRILVSESFAVVLEKLWSVLPKSWRRRINVGIHNPIYLAQK